MNPSSPAVRLAAVLLLAGLAAVAWRAGQAGLADVVSKQSRYEMERWRSGKFVPDARELDAMQAGLNQARQLDPGNPDLLEDLGRFQAARVEGGRTYDTGVRAMRRQALDWFRQALELRPTSGHAWVDVALMKFRLREIDQEFIDSLQQALRRSPWEP